MNQLSIQEVKEKINQGAIVIDTRPSERFALGFIPHSIHIPMSANYAEYVELYVEPEFEVVLIAEEGKEMLAYKNMTKTGLVNVAGVLTGGYEAWAAEGATPDLIIDISVDEFEMDYQFDEFYLLDTRGEDDYETEHLEYAETIPLSDIEDALPDLNPNLLYYIYGTSYEDAMFAASLFKQHDFHKLRVVNQGYEAIKATKIPVVKKKKQKADRDFSDN